ncbi:MAG TPA: glycerol-3-phosphate 1-O-acyltransferase PlsY [Methylomirabilota bacterium]|nr:glycerol-3-phosphate 1-O-acyltransferase PlsY [Methylomirabilota bacterium]
MGAYALTAVFGYLLGSIPTGYVMARAKGVDIRKVGSGNIGATNVMRILGRPLGILVLLFDAAKGWIACNGVPLLVLSMAGGAAGDGEPATVNLAITGGIAAILGHNYTCWLRFKGGKGIATSAGVMLGLAPMALLAALGIWIVVVVLSRYVSLGSIVAAACLPFSVWWCGGSPQVVVVAALLGALAIYKHRSNIQRLIQGTENRIGSQRRTQEHQG